MSAKLVPMGVVLQRLDEVANDLPETYEYEGLSSYNNTPLDGICNEPEAIALQREYYDWILCQKPDGTYTVKPEAFYTPVFLKRYLSLCAELRLQVRCLFVEYDGAEPLWRFKLPEIRAMGYEVCHTPRSLVIARSLDRPGFSKYRHILNRFGLFDTLETASSFKDAYVREYEEASAFRRSGQLEPPDIHICRLYTIEAFPESVQLSAQVAESSFARSAREEIRAYSSGV